MGNRREQPTQASDADEVAMAPNVDKAPPATFEGMWEYDPDEGGHMAQLCGYLTIDDPYVYGPRGSARLDGSHRSGVEPSQGWRA